MMSFGDSGWREWVLGRDDAEPIVRTALENGVTFFDTANAYSFGASEQITGELLGKHARREEIVVATKVFFPDRDGATPNEHGLSRKSILGAIDRSLTRLDMDYVDLYQIHRFDPSVPIEETMGVLHELVVVGKARYIGASSMWAWQFARMQEAARSNGWTEFVSMQSQYSLLYREEEREMIPLCLAEGVGLLPWSPLARGRLARPPQRFTDGGTLRAETDEIQESFYREADQGIVDAVASVAAELGAHQAQVALAWLLSKPGVAAPVVGATEVAHLEIALGGVDIELEEAQLTTLEEGYRPMPILDH